ncbi:hypothetical protein TNCV_3219861 [Trichonephila clavipes]|nr:hypothetical protein TNCV_3219861 [Trichonephila clavipes]
MGASGWLIACPMGRQLFVFVLGVRLEYDWAMVELVKGISKLPDRRLEADRPRHSIQFINDTLEYDYSLPRFNGFPETRVSHVPIGTENLSQGFVL